MKPKFWIDLSEHYNAVLAILGPRSKRHLVLYPLDRDKPMQLDGLDQTGLFSQPFEERPEGYWYCPEPARPDMLVREGWLRGFPQCEFRPGEELSQSVWFETPEALLLGIREDQEAYRRILAETQDSENAEGEPENVADGSIEDEPAPTESGSVDPMAEDDPHGEAGGEPESKAKGLQDEGRYIPFSRKELAQMRALREESTARADALIRQEWLVALEDRWKPNDSLASIYGASSKGLKHITSIAAAIRRDDFLGPLKQRLKLVQKAENAEKYPDEVILKTALLRGLYATIPASSAGLSDFKREVRNWRERDAFWVILSYKEAVQAIGAELENLPDELGTQDLQRWLFPGNNARGATMAHTFYRRDDLAKLLTQSEPPEWIGKVREGLLLDPEEPNRHFRPGNLLSGTFTQKNEGTSGILLMEVFRHVLETSGFHTAESKTAGTFSSAIREWCKEFVDRNEKDFEDGELRTFGKCLRGSLPFGYVIWKGLQNQLSRSEEGQLLMCRFLFEWSLKVAQEMQNRSEAEAQQKAQGSPQDSPSPEDPASESSGSPDAKDASEFFWMDLPNRSVSEKHFELPNGSWVRSVTSVDPSPRGDADISMEDFLADTGLSGVQFGNYVTQKERQEMMNAVYDSWHDLAAVLDVPPQALAAPLGGEKGPILGLALGARGAGRNLAHYEPSVSTHVINLTKTKGFGVLAHEVVHALDASMGSVDGVVRYASETSGPLYHFLEDTVRSSRKISTTTEAMEQARMERLQKLEQDFRDKAALVVFSKKHLEHYQSWLKSELSDKSLSDELRANLFPVLRDKVLSVVDGYGKAAVLPNGNRAIALSAFAESTGILRQSSVLRWTWTIPDTLQKDFLERSQKLGLPIPSSGDLEKMSQAYYHMFRDPFGKLFSQIQEDQPQARSLMQENNDFHLSAIRMDKGRAKPYWSSKREEMARVGQAVLRDLAEEKGIRNDFLFALSDPGRYSQNLAGNPNPEGDERRFFKESFQETVIPALRSHLLHCYEQRLAASSAESPQSDHSGKNGMNP